MPHVHVSANEFIGHYSRYPNRFRYEQKKKKEIVIIDGLLRGYKERKYHEKKKIPPMSSTLGKQNNERQKKENYFPYDQCLASLVVDEAEWGVGVREGNGEP